MKRCLPGLFIGFALMIMPLSLCFASASPAGKITHLEGKVQIIHQGETVAAKAQAEVFATDEIKTGPKAIAELILADGSSLHIGPDSWLVLSRYKFSLAEKKPSFIAKMFKGAFVYISGAISKVHPGAVQLETPESTIGIRGTKLVIKIGSSGFESVKQSNEGDDKIGKTIVVLLKDPSGHVGSVTISNKQGQKILDKNQYAILIRDGEGPSKQFLIDEETLKALIPESLWIYLSEGYAPPLPYTEILKSLNDLNTELNQPEKIKHISASSPPE